MELLTIAGLAMLALWAAGTFFFEAPGIIHLFLTLGLFFVVLGIAKRSQKAK